MVAIGALVGLWIFQRELQRSLVDSSAVDSALAGVLGGLAGAKLLWDIEHHREDALLNLLLSRGGMSWFGGFVGGIAAGLVVMQWKRLPKGAVLAAAAPALAGWQGIGPVGWFFLWGDHGRTAPPS